MKSRRVVAHLGQEAGSAGEQGWGSQGGKRARRESAEEGEVVARGRDEVAEVEHGLGKG